jgi:hypothetical protein
VEVQNASAKAFDSVQVFIENTPGGQPSASFGPLRPGQSMPPLTVTELFGGPQGDILATAIFYAADTVIRCNGPYTAV